MEYTDRLIRFGFWAFVGVLSLIVLAVFWQAFVVLRRNNWQWRALFRAFCPTFLRVFWIMFGIVLPMIALGTEKVTEICARMFFDPLPTDWHFLLFALIPISNLVGELLNIRWLRERAAWLGGPLLKWINGMAIGIAAFYAAWFFPMALICSTLFLIGLGALVVWWPWTILTTLVSHPGQLLEGAGAIFWAPPSGALVLGTLLLIPLAPLLSCLACLRIRKKLFAMEQPLDSNDPTPATDASVSAIHPGFIALGLAIFAGSLYLLAKYWIPFAFSQSGFYNFSPQTPIKDLFLTWGPPLIFFLVFLWPTPISPVRWFRGQRSPQVPKSMVGKPFERVLLPLAFGLFALLAIEIPSTATRVAMSMALDPKNSTQGLLLLRAFGNDDSMLRMCYEKSHATDVIGSILTWNKPISAEKAREMYYRATGKPFNTRLVPASFRGKTHDFFGRSDMGADDVFDWDTELAGETVGGVVRGVSLAQSDIKGEIDASSHLAKINWVMQFENKSPFLREARAQILLPPHAVVSGVWLWIHGIPHPAAFNSRGLTRAAYKAVVQRRRDPLLVTTYGPDRLLSQCFPVPPNGTLRIKLSITSPLNLGADGKIYLPMPMFLERNFRVTSHDVYLSANDNISNPAAILHAGTANQKAHELKGNLPNEDLCLGKGTIVVAGNLKDNSSWSNDVASDGDVILESMHRISIQKPKKLVIVIDGSAAMAENASSLSQILRSVPEGIRLTLIRAGDKVEVIADDVPESSGAKWADALESLQSKTFVGGQDDVAALVKAFDFIQKKQPAAILWVHGPQPVKIEQTDTLADLLNHSQSNVRLYELQMENGPNRTAEALDGIANVIRLPAIISCEASLKDLFYQWAGGAGEYELSFDKVNVREGPATLIASKSTIDMSPLWANQEIGKLRSLGATDKSKDAVEIAKEYRVVTPVSGAVVLETDKDYKRFGLSTSQPKSNKGLSIEKEHVAGLKELVANSIKTNVSESDKALVAQKSEFEQRSSRLSAASPSSASESNLEPSVSDDSYDVSAVPEPDSWLFVLSISGVLWLFRRRILRPISN